jgi:hypothetical protein
VPGLDRADMLRLFRLLSDELGRRKNRGELFVVGGAVMCLVYEARPSTRDVDAVFRPTREVRDAAAVVASRAGLDPDWLSDAVKGYLSDRGGFTPFLELPHLGVSVAPAEYLLAMKCLAFRIGPEFHDEDDVRYLLRHLGVESQEGALAILTRYYPLERFPQKTLYALEEILGT